MITTSPSIFDPTGDTLQKEKDSGMLRSGVEGVDYLEILNKGDLITLVHKWSKEERKVIFDGVTEKTAFVNWPMCGQYEVDLRTGTLKGKKANLWVVRRDDMKKILSSVRMETCRLHESFKKNKTK
jgi:hypothetical protein